MDARRALCKPVSYTHLVFPVIEAAEQLSGLKYGENEDADVRFRVVADHVRSALMIMSDGVRPVSYTHLRRT